METLRKVKVLRIYLSSTDKFKHTSLYEAIVFAAKRGGLMGATVLKGVMGYGASNKIHIQKFWEISEKTPLVVEIIDSEEKIDLFVEKISPWFEKIKTGVLLTVTEANVLIEKKGSPKKLPL